MKIRIDLTTPLDDGMYRNPGEELPMKASHMDADNVELSEMGRLAEFYLAANGVLVPSAVEKAEVQRELRDKGEELKTAMELRRSAEKGRAENKNLHEEWRMYAEKLEQLLKAKGHRLPKGYKESRPRR